MAADFPATVQKAMAAVRCAAACLAGEIKKEWGEWSDGTARARWRQKIDCALAGLRATYKSEAAFRLEVLGAAILTPLAWTVGDNAFERGVLVAVVFLVLVVELINTALEDGVDLAHPQPHPLAGKIKDAASAAVFLSLLLAATVWVGALLG